MKTREQDAISGNALAALVGNQFLNQRLAAAHTPLSSARLSSSAETMSYQARMTQPPLMVTGIVGALGIQSARRARWADSAQGRWGRNRCRQRQGHASR